MGQSLGSWSWELEVAVLFSAGLDSAVLAASEARAATVHPIYVSCGLAWEQEELAIAERLLATPAYRGCSRSLA